MAIDCMVFGSNTKGIHGKGAAKDARDYYGATLGWGEGFQKVGLHGSSYAIPTKGNNFEIRSLGQIEKSVDEFLELAKIESEILSINFLITRIGCGLAGYKNHQIAPMFVGAPDNCSFDPEWLEFGLKTWMKAPHKR